MIEMHKKQLEWFKSKLGISDYTVAWIAFLKGLILGLLIYHFFKDVTISMFCITINFIVIF